MLSSIHSLAMFGVENDDISIKTETAVRGLTEAKTLKQALTLMAPPTVLTGFQLLILHYDIILQ